ncbi:MAG: hypothetical protein GY854_17005 [Deltaproteobacteria bacterium]|nr:hypothetical protein [Deltaproteobacteria bacterium]
MKKGSSRNKVIQVLFFIVLVLAMATTATAQKKKKRKKGGGGVIRLEETIIEGRVQKPNAFFINTRQALVYEGMALKESFVDEISKAVETGSF